MNSLKSNLICFSHLRWGFVFQRPQHLMSRFARENRVYFFEEPILEGSDTLLECVVCPKSHVRVLTPKIPAGTDKSTIPGILKNLLERLIAKEEITDFIAWYYTPMAIEFTRDLKPALTIYDCMDELSAFANAPADMLRNERQLLDSADLVFTGGASLYESKRRKHRSAHLYPSSVEVEHFSKALTISSEPEDQKLIPHPRIGYVGVIDERMDLELLSYLAAKRPDWQILMVGPVVKIDARALPQQPNIHYLGMKAYSELPAYLSGWDVALLPFAQNEATRFISPTKTPEYLAAGLPVVSTPITDVVKPYGELGLVSIGSNHGEFLRNVEHQLGYGKQSSLSPAVADFLRRQSWDKTWRSMHALMAEEVMRKKQVALNNASRTSFLAAAGAVHV